MNIFTKRFGKLRLARTLEGEVRIYGGRRQLETLARVAMIDCEPVTERRWLRTRHHVAVTEIELAMVIQFLVEQVPVALTRAG